MNARGRIIVSPHDGRRFHIGGRKRAVARGPRLALKHYLDMSTLPPSPASIDYTKKAVDISNVLSNDTLGCCTCSGVGHIIDVLTGNADAPDAVTAEQVIALYSASCGYVVGDESTDQGGDELTVLDYVAEHGIDGKGLHKFDASVLVAAKNKAEVMAAMDLFGNLYFGVGLPDAWVNPFPSGDGFTWDVGSPDPNNGHCFIGVGYNDVGVQIDTWGLIGTVTWEAVAKLASPSSGGELHTILSCDWINRASMKAPSGFDINALMSDLKMIGAVAA